MTSPDPDDPETALREARARFVADFPHRITALSLLVDTIGQLGARGPVGSLRQLIHRMAGLAGMVGLPTVSVVASDIEQLLGREDGAAPDAAALGQGLQRLKTAFGTDLARTPPSWAVDGEAAPAGARVLLVEDDDEQRALGAKVLRAAGYRVVTHARGEDAVEVARAEAPDLILLDVDLPGLDGMEICRTLKSDAALAATPVIFLSARGGLVDRMAGLTLGADDYVTKPYDPRELLLRIRRLLARGGPAPAASAPASGGPLLGYDTFALTSREALREGTASLALIRCDADRVAGLAAALADDLRRRDLIARYSETHLVVLMPEVAAAAAAERLAAVIGRLWQDASGMAAGVTSTAGSRRDLEGLLAEADIALAAARYQGRRVALHGATPPPAADATRAATTILIAEDDPDVLLIVETRLKAEGYTTILAFDGQQAVSQVEAHAPAVLLLDLMMPKLSGFDVLARLRDRPATKPKVIVISARGREEDVTRAFDLGADDYLTKPFSPQELVARIARLLR